MKSPAGARPREYFAARIENRCNKNKQMERSKLSRGSRKVTGAEEAVWNMSSQRNHNEAVQNWMKVIFHYCFKGKKKTPSILSFKIFSPFRGDYSQLGRTGSENCLPAKKLEGRQSGTEHVKLLLDTRWRHGLRLGERRTSTIQRNIRLGERSWKRQFFSCGF